MPNQNFQKFLSNYYLTTKGIALLKEEEALLNLCLNKVFGYYLVQIGQTTKIDLLSENRINYKIIVDSLLNQDNCLSNYCKVTANIDYLPFKSDSIDAVFIPHTLETVPDPYHLLRQVDKMILPEGNLVISGFNPFGRHLVSIRLGKYRKQLKQVHFIKEARIVDWLNLLGYDIECIRYKRVETKQGFFSVVINKIVLILNRMGIEFGNVYVILAKKRIESSKPIDLNWKLANWLPVKKGQVAMNNSSHRNK